MPSPRRRITARAATAVALALVAVLSGACSDGSSRAATVDVGDGRIAASRLAAVGDAVCRAAGEARRDPGAARTTFFADAHDGLHTIARALEEADRPAAAELLVAKQAVEAAFTADTSGAELAGALTRLAGATRAGLARLDVEVRPCGPRAA